MAFHGRQALAKFLTNHGFRIAKGTLDRLHTQRRGPPVYGKWGDVSGHVPLLLSAGHPLKTWKKVEEFLCPRFISEQVGMRRAEPSMKYLHRNGH